MKNYFDFLLPAKKLIIYYLMFLVFFILPYVWIIYNFTKKIHQEPEGLIILIPVIVFLILFVLAFNFFFIKLCIENVQLNDEKLTFKGDFSGYLGQILLGLLLSIITLGIYYPWFVRKIYQYFAFNSNFKENSFQFMSKGLNLFLIFLIGLFIPMVIFTSIIKITGINIEISSSLNYYLGQFIKTLIIIPFMIYYYRWIIHFKYKDYQIKLNVNFWQSAGKLLVEIFLAMLTFGLYLPLAYLRIFKYFIDHTEATNEVKKYEFGYEIDNLKDFLFLWGQLLLTIITLGLYLPWSTVKIYKRVIRKTYMQEKIN